MKNWAAWAAAIFLFCQIESVNHRLGQMFPWFPEPIFTDIPRIYATREEALQAHREAGEIAAKEDCRSMIPQPDPEDEWALILVRADHPLPENYHPDLEMIQPGYSHQADSRIVDDLHAMLEAAEQDGEQLMICSAYRSYDQQAYNLRKSIESYVRSGYSQTAAEQTAHRYIAPAGASEHQTGLAVDIVTPAHQTLDSGYADTSAAKWLRENAAKYGFILRYPQNKTDITGIYFEPWHYRYVGKTAAEYIMEQEICLEEYLEQLEEIPEEQV